MTTHIVDRRLNPGGKSLSNRQKFIERSKASIRKAVRKATESGSIEDVLKGGDITISTDGIGEPFLHTRGGIRDMVLPGNKKYVQGDILERPGGGGGKGNGAGEGNDGMDEFQFTLTREEFLELFLGDLELPEMVKRKLVDTESAGLRRAGYSATGSPANISISRTARKAAGRRVALRRPSDAEIAEQLKRADDVWERDQDEGTWAPEYSKYLELVRRAKIVLYIDPLDVRYRRFEPQPKPNAQAVMFCIMDVSGSMSEHMKDLAKRFYMLLYVFLTRGYTHVELVFIRHTDSAKEVDEETFFRGTDSGGTCISPALQLALDIAKQRYSPANWNIYMAQATDGDNQRSDNPVTAKLMTNEVLPIVQYFAYLEVMESHNFDSTTSELWDTYLKIKNDKVPLAMRRVKDRAEIYPVFRELFRKRMPGEVE